MSDPIKDYARAVAEAVYDVLANSLTPQVVDLDRIIATVPAPEPQPAHTPSSEAPHHPACTRSFDARDWARDFRETAKSLGYCDMDEGWLIGWFANAIMRGFDEAERRREQPATACSFCGERHTDEKFFTPDRHTCICDECVTALAKHCEQTAPQERTCTCTGTCKGQEGLAPGWRCALSVPAPVMQHHAAPTCKWTEDADEGSWSTECGETWTLLDGSPAENGVRFCFGCGRPLLPPDTTEPAQDDGLTPEQASGKMSVLKLREYAPAPTPDLDPEEVRRELEREDYHDCRLMDRVAFEWLRLREQIAKLDAANEELHDEIDEMMGIREQPDEPFTWERVARRVGEEFAQHNGPDGYYGFTPAQWQDWMLSRIYALREQPAPDVQDWETTCGKSKDGQHCEHWYDDEPCHYCDDDTKPAPEVRPKWCNVHQHHKWCEHNGGVMGPTGYAAPDEQAQVVTFRTAELDDVAHRALRQAAQDVFDEAPTIQTPNVQVQIDAAADQVCPKHGCAVCEECAIDAAVAREREECARIAEEVWDSGNQGAHGGEQANRTAAAIRARSAKREEV